MIHNPIQIKNLELHFPAKICFNDFTVQINHARRIAIIGANGSGKSTLLKILQGSFKATSGEIKIPEDVVLGYVPQVIDEFDHLSGGQRLNKAITQALSVQPNLLLLDESTNHLDLSNRKSFLHMLKAYTGTLIVVSHDTELLRNQIDTIWHIDNGKINIFSGNYDDYMNEMRGHRTAVEKELSQLSREKKEMHEALMKEQKRAAKSTAKGQKSIEQRKWPSVVSKSKALRAQETSGRKKSAIDQKKQNLTEALSKLRLPEIIRPKFSINAADVSDKTIISIRAGNIAYQNTNKDFPAFFLQKIDFSMSGKERVAVIGDNASGKSTLIRAILNDERIVKTGDWLLPKGVDIGYLDQHYTNLLPQKTVFDTIAELVPAWSHIDIRRHLNDFLFRKNEEVNARTFTLSGGEKARLSLAQISATTPKILILDEITNNLDLETKEHVIEVLKNYPAALLVISHDQDFLSEIGINSYYQITENILSRSVYF
jgi:ATPase subunit of ABC transporter with duplicated ATPase domains